MKSNKAQSFLILSIALCVVLGFVMYMYFYKPQIEKTEQLVASNNALKARVEELMVFNEEMPNNLAEIEKMSKDIQTKLENFPADVKEEDMVDLALTVWENNILVGYEEIDMGEREVLDSIPAEVVAGAAIEGMDQELSFTQRTASYKTRIFYKDLKDFITCINDNQDELAITEVSYTITDEGYLQGHLNTTFYTAQGTGREYVNRTFADFPVGLTDLFDIKRFEDGVDVLPEELRDADATGVSE